ncbi:Alpha/Beta hydrolase protein [Peziza echinospora]|nr:Alpha/Beta hydrolase protein [Peziza echinospora]
MRHSIARRFRRKAAYAPTSSTPANKNVTPLKNTNGITTHANPIDPEVDVIFVHGLDGGSVSTWAKNEDPRAYWPKEWLPKELELSRARIHTYGYNQDQKRDLHSYWDYAGQFLTELVCSPMWFGTLPIVLVGHSTGGLIIKRAYVMSVLSPLYSRITASIQSFIFLSTPHNPITVSSYKKWRKSNNCLISKPALDALLTLTADQFERALHHQPQLPGTTRHHHRHNQPKRIISILEAQSSLSLKRGGKKRTTISTRESCTIGVEGEIVAVMGTKSHAGTARFSAPNDADYACFYRYLKGVVAEIRFRNEREPIIAPPEYTREWDGRYAGQGGVAMGSPLLSPGFEVDGERRNTW